MMLELIWTIQLAPLIAFLVIILGGRFARKPAPWIALACALAALGANLILWTKYGPQAPAPLEFKSLWINSSSMKTLPLFGVQPQALSDIFVGFLVDPVNLLMLTVVTVISFFVQMFSVFYMAEENDKPRYFAFLSLFSFCMIGLVLSSNLLQTFMFWEGVGLTSYLLIGFWFEKPAAADAARKAFVVNRLADLGFLAALTFLFLAFGTLELSQLKTQALTQALPLWLLTITGILVFLGVAGKSAQFPFHVWLPDAMEGPTPVSALIHSATMVAAGVFLLARVYDLFASSAATMWVILATGAVTALLAATVAVVQRDIKRVLAYSTISQLGLMVMGIASGAMAAGLYHLVTHAFFKSLLFLTAGAFIHHFGTNDLFEMAKKGARRQTFLVGVLCVGLFSLAGIFPFSGFFSKDAILHHLMTEFPGFFLAGLVVTLFTSFYSFRMLFIILFTETGNRKQETGGHGHPSPVTGHLSLGVFERVPLAVLAALSLVAGFAGTPLLGERLIHWIDSHAHAAPLDFRLLAATAGVIIAGGVWAWFWYREPSESAEETRAKSPAARVLARKYFMDDLYFALVKGVGLRLAKMLRWFDVHIVNGLMVDRTSLGVKQIGALLSRLQNGIFQDYLFIAVIASLAALIYLQGIK